MLRKYAVFVAVLTLFAFVINPVVGNAGDFAIGAKLENFSLPDTTGKVQAFNDLKGKNGAVIVFLSVQCPVVKGYDDRINQIAADYQAKGINFIGINSNATESAEAVKMHAAANYKFTVLKDEGNVIADKLGATVTPEAYYFDANNVLLYHGAIDNDKSGRAVTDNYLRTAFDSSLSGKAIEKTRANAFGCTIKRGKG